MAPPPKHAGLRLPFISITLGRGEGLPPLIAGIATFFSLLIITSILSRSYCSEKRDCLTIAPLKIEIPTGVWGSIAGAFSGAIFTYGVFNLLEIQKAKREPKPHLRPSFDSCDEDCLVVDSHPHPIFLPSRDSQHAAKQFVGSASYLRVKVTNTGPVVCENVRAYITELLVFDVSNKSYRRVARFKEPMALLWAFEKKYDLYDDGKGLDLPSQASRYADILVSYERVFTPSNPRASSNDVSINSSPADDLIDVWFLKLKTVVQPTRHERMLEIPFGSDIEYKINVSVYGDKAVPQSISITLCHKSGMSQISVKGNSEDLSVDSNNGEQEVLLSLHNTISEWDESLVSKDIVYQQL
jgi:hypothetical protein